MEATQGLRVRFPVDWYNQGKPKEEDACLHCCVRALLWKSSNDCGVATARETTNEYKACAKKVTE